MQSQPKKRHHTLFHLFLRLQEQQSGNGGYSLVVTVAMLLILSTLIISAAVVSKINGASTSSSAKSNTGFFSAEAGLNIRAQDIRRRFEGYNRPTGTSPGQWQSCLGSPANQGTGDFACDSKTFQGQNNVSYVVEDAANPSAIIIPNGERFAGLSAQEYRYELNSVSLDADEQPTAILGMSFRSRLVPMFQFAVFYDKDLEILPGPTLTLSGPVHANGDIYLNAGNALNILGQVTVGKDQDGSSNGLYRGRKNSNQCNGSVTILDPTNPVNAPCSGSSRTAVTDVSPWNDQVKLNIDYLDIPPPEALNADPGNPDAVYWQQSDFRVVLEVDANGDPLDQNGNGTVIEVRNADGSRNTTATNALQNSCNVPETSLLSDDDGSVVYEANDTKLIVDNASGFSAGDIITLVNSSGAVVDADSNIVKSISGNEITLQRQLMHSSYQTGTLNPANISVRKAVVSTSDTFYNYREGKFIRMLDVDAQALMTCVDANGNALTQDLLDSGKALDDDTEGGLVWFFGFDGPDANVDVTNGDPDGNNYGVRVRNGAELASTNGSAPTIQGLTIITDQAFYVRGDYNSINKKPAAFLTDSLNVLSKKWDFGYPGIDPDTDSFDGRQYSNGLPTTADNKNDRTTENTTINAAFLGGTDSSGGVEGTGGQDSGNYNGGVENYPRFHEKWSGTSLNYRGSFVSLNKARRVDGAWGSQSYSPPGRNWDYDTDFNDAANLPPLTPRFVYLRQELFRRNFDQVSSHFNSYVSSLPQSLGGLSTQSSALNFTL